MFKIRYPAFFCPFKLSKYAKKVSKYAKSVCARPSCFAIWGNLLTFVQKTEIDMTLCV